ncbi:MAG: hypothetical protein LM564_00155 [Desulfurococcaceae archaeon]|nr:hypothetical protein [Desulfurococcaceae archaeon]
MGTAPAGEVPEREARPERGGPGAGAGATAPAFEAPIVKCEEYEYRYNIKMPGRTLYILIDTSKWEIVRPTRKERSKTGAHGKDVYCMEPEKWRNIIVVALERSNSGKLHYEVYTENPELEKYVRELEYLLSRRRGFWDMEVTVESWVEIHRGAATVIYERGEGDGL